MTTGAAMLAGGGLVSLATSQPATASVNGALSIPDATGSGSGGVPQTLSCQVSGNYEYSTNGADTAMLALQAASAVDAGDWESLATDEQALSTASGAGSYQLAGSILDHSGLSASDFEAPAEETVQTDVPLRVLLEVLSGGAVVADATAGAIVTVGVKNTDVVSSAALTGSGELTVEV